MAQGEGRAGSDRVRQRLVRTARILGSLLLALAIGFAVLVIALGAGDPIDAARERVPAYSAQRAAAGSIAKDGAVRLYEEMILSAPGRPPVRFTVSLPEGEAREPLPLLLILGGLRSGRENLERLPPLGANALIAAEYPYRDIIRDKTRSIPARLAASRRAAQATPEQLVAILDWARMQPWADRQRMSLLGYSLGAMFVPVTQEKARANEIGIKTSILAFGGADLGRIIATVFHVETPGLREIVELLAAALLHPVEPSYFLGRMTGEVLVVNAEEDEMIPRESAALMTRLTPEPKWVVTMEGEHIDPRDPAMLRRVVDVTRAWLVERGAANPER